MVAKVPKVFNPLFNGELKDKRYIIYYGGRGGAKTENIALWLITRLLSENNINILCLREFQNSTGDSLGATFKSWLQRLGFDKQVIFEHNRAKSLIDSRITSIMCRLTGSKVIFKGVSKRTAINIKSLSNVKYCWVEEAQYLTEETFNILAPTIRADDSQIILSFNPMRENDFVYQYFIKEPPPTAYIKKTSYSDNPFFPKVLERDRITDKETKPKALYDWIWEGGFYPELNDAVIVETKRFGRFDDSKHFDYTELYITMDTAFSTKSSADYSVIAVWGRLPNALHLLRLVRGQWDFSTLIEQLLSMHSWADSQDYGLSVSNTIIEAKASGQSLIQELRRVTNLYITPITPTKDKFTRLCEVIGDLGLVSLPLANTAINSWVESFIDECHLFRADMKHAHDDQVDALIYGLDYYKSNVPVDYEAINRDIFGDDNIRGTMWGLR